MAGSLAAGYQIAAIDSKATTVTSTATSTSSVTTTATLTETSIRTVFQGNDCKQSANDSTYPTSYPIPVLQLLPGTAAEVCALYNFYIPLNYTFFVNIQSTLTKCAASSCPSLVETVSPKFVEVDKPMNLTVAYRITAPSGAAPGLYWLWVLDCVVVDVVVGPLPSSISSVNTGPTSCVAMLNEPAAPIVVGMTNATFAHVPVD